MNVLLLRPVPRNERFGLGPFFRIEPLGMEYIGAALISHGHRVTLRDLRFARTPEHYIRATRPQLVGIACMHALETDDALALAERVRRASPDAFILVGGHSAAAFPAPFFQAEVDAICLDDGERVVPELADTLETGGRARDVAGLLVRQGRDEFVRTASDPRPFSLDEVPLPARHLVDGWRREYACLHHRPTYLIETARGCPFRCSFCSVWQLFDRSFRERSIESVCEDFASAGDHIFVADDLFWNHAPRSRALADALRARGVRKQWILVQSRVDTVANHPDLLEAWRPLAVEFDIFFGLEAATNEGLSGLIKDTTIDRTAEGVRVAREHRYGVTGNFVIDPAWTGADFERLWDFVARHELHRAGFTILTPLPGTAYYDEMRDRIRAVEWAQFDMHHLLWEPALGADRFFELYCETWRRSVLNLKGEKKWWQWARHAHPRNWMFMTRALMRTQQMMKPAHYLGEHRLSATAWQHGAAREPRQDIAV
jgi:hopanoid C-3 methylase